MEKAAYVHIVDRDVTRRAQIARTLYTRHFHAEIYESLEELSKSAPVEGALLLSDELGEAVIGDAVTWLQAHATYVPYAVFSAEPSPQKIVKAMSSGALDYLEWPCAAEELIASVNRVCDVGRAQARGKKLKSDALRLIRELSPRELDVLRLVVRGLSNKAMAKELGISPRTIEIHRANMMDRLNAESLAHAVRIGVYAGLD